MKEVLNTSISTENIIISCKPFGELLANNKIRYSYGVIGIITAILSIFVVTLNGSVIVALVTLKQYRTPSNMLLIMLSVVDFTSGLTVLPMYTVYMRYMMEGKLNCILSKVLIVSGYSLTLLSCITIAFITTQLYLAIVKPFTYHQSINKFGYLPMLLSSWLIILSGVNIFVFGLPRYWRWFKTCTGGAFLMIYFNLCFAHRRIFQACKDMNKVSKASKTFIHVHRKTIRMVFTVLIAFGICYLPYVIYALYVSIFGLNASIRSYFGPWVEVIALLNNSFDPLIYCFRLKSVRNKIYQMLHRKKRQPILHHFLAVSKQVSTSVISLQSVKLQDQMNFYDHGKHFQKHSNISSSSLTVNTNCSEGYPSPTSPWKDTNLLKVVQNNY